MPNPVITPRAFAVILLASIGKDVSAFVVQIPEHLLIKVQAQVVNFGIQYGAIAIGQAAVGSQFVDPYGPKRLFLQGVESLSTAKTPEEAASRGMVAAAVLLFSGLSAEDPNASLTFGGFLIILVQNVLFPTSQCLCFMYPIAAFRLYAILIKGVTELRIEKQRRKFNLPRVKLNFNIFRKQNQDLTLKYIRFKKRKLKIFSRNISLFLPYQKELKIKSPKMVEQIIIK